uniref:Uncharacterized protein n=1 Tax=Romanomermis culicivorax TaxID=13658 RepID=A0A915JP69_ROMCU
MKKEKIFNRARNNYKPNIAGWSYYCKPTCKKVMKRYHSKKTARGISHGSFRYASCNGTERDET